MTDHDKKRLLQLARESITAQLRGESLPNWPLLQEEPVGYGGAFVTLRNARNGHRLRGCIGQFQPTELLGTTIQSMAVAALADPRFRSVPVKFDELPDLRIEISVLSPMKRTEDPLSLVPGVHGVLIRRNGRSGCFLPQVAVEQQWDRHELLSHCCAEKAGLDPEAWRDPQTKVYLFEAIIFSEDDED